MKDLIDLGNRVFDILIKDHGEDPESRTLFLYSLSIDSPQPWYVLGSDKRVMITQSGVSISFQDDAIASLNLEWTKLIEDKKSEHANRVLSKIKSQNFSPKDGDTFNFWENEGPWKEIKL